MDRLQAGDLILVSPVRAGAMARLIRRVQGEEHDEFDAQWVHAAGYLGDNVLVELDGGGVHLNELSKYVPDYRLLFRRPLDQSGRQVDEVTGYKIAVSALMALKTNYKVTDLVRIGWETTWAGWGVYDRSELHTGGNICSTFYNRAVFNVLERPASKVKRRIIQPADLCRSDRLTDLAVGWAPLA